MTEGQTDFCRKLLYNFLTFLPGTNVEIFLNVFTTQFILSFETPLLRPELMLIIDQIWTIFILQVPTDFKASLNIKLNHCSYFVRSNFK